MDSLWGLGELMTICNPQTTLKVEQVIGPRMPPNLSSVVLPDLVASGIVLSHLQVQIYRREWSFACAVLGVLDDNEPQARLCIDSVMFQVIKNRIRCFSETLS